MELSGVNLSGCILGEKMASGAFGDVFWAKDFNNLRMVAIKIERIERKGDASFLKKESEILQELGRAVVSEPILRHYEYGEREKYRYMIMELGGMNLRELKKETSCDQFTMGTSLWIAKKMLEALKLLHQLGWVHRDVKPANFCIGRGKVGKRSLFIVDFGITRRYKQGDKVIPPRDNCNFRGTMRYASIRAHQRKDAGPCDDLWSLYYVGVENMVGMLPWRRLNDGNSVMTNKQFHTRDEFTKKRARNPIYAWLQPPPSFENLLERLVPSDYYSKFDYETTKAEIEADLGRIASMKLDWES